MIEIRKATLVDIPAIVELGRAMHMESPRFARFAFDPEKAAEMARRVITLPSGIYPVAIMDGRVVGMMMGFVMEHFFSPARYASELVLYVTPGSRGSSAAPRLIRAFEERAVELGALEAVPGVSTQVNEERTQKLYERRGYVTAGYIMLKDLMPCASPKL